MSIADLVQAACESWAEACRIDDDDPTDHATPNAPSEADRRWWTIESNAGRPASPATPPRYSLVTTDEDQAHYRSRP
jgi:hypothetical protein